MTEQSPTNATLTAEQVAKAKAEARTAAEKRLRDLHPDEFRRLMVEEHTARGVEYTPRLTAKERAEKEIERLAREHGISLALNVETIEDGLVEVNGAEAVPHSARLAQSLQEASERVPEGTPVIDGDATPEQRRAAAAESIFGSPSAY